MRATTFAATLLATGLGALSGQAAPVSGVVSFSGSFLGFDVSGSAPVSFDTASAVTNATAVGATISGLPGFVEPIVYTYNGSTLWIGGAQLGAIDLGSPQPDFFVRITDVAGDGGLLGGGAVSVLIMILADGRGASFSGSAALSIAPSVPEPASLALLGAGLLGLAAVRRRARAA